MSTRMVQRNFVGGNKYSKEHKLGLKDISMHWHDFYEIDIILSGNGETVCNGKTFPVKRGLVSILAPTDFHEYRVTEEMDLINIKFEEPDLDHELLSRIFNEKSNIVYTKEKHLEAIEGLCRLTIELDSHRYTQEYYRKLLEALILILLDCSSHEESWDIESEVIQKAVVYMNTHFQENPKMSAIAEMCHLNENYFCRLFKNSVGMSYKEYLKKLKLDYAMKLIHNTNLSITDIAEKCGYETQSHFNREFKACYQQTPTSLRRDKPGT